MVLTAIAAALITALSPASADVSCVDGRGQTIYGVWHPNGTVNVTGGGAEGRNVARARGDGTVVSKSCTYADGWVSEGLGVVLRGRVV